MFAFSPALLQDRREVLTATSTSGNPNACFEVEYASSEPRPVEITRNGQEVNAHALRDEAGREGRLQHADLDRIERR
jgi:hypothetical protein